MEQGGEVYGTFAFLQQFKLASLNATSYLKGQPLASYMSSGIFEKERLESTWNIELAPNSAGKKKHAKIVFLQFVWNSTWTSQGETWALASRRAMFTDTPVSKSSCTRSRSMFRTLWTSEANSPPQVQQASVERCAIKIRPRDRGQRWPAVSSAKKPFFQKMPHKTRLTGMDYTLTLQVQSLAHICARDVASFGFLYRFMIWKRIRYNHFCTSSSPHLHEASTNRLQVDQLRVPNCNRNVGFVGLCTCYCSLAVHVRGQVPIVP